MSEPAIQVDNITYSYGDIQAVKGISFDVQPGEILGFLGPNGAGKSTTIKMLTGQMNPERAARASWARTSPRTIPRSRRRSACASRRRTSTST